MPALNGAFFDAVRPLFGGKLSQSQVDGLTIIVRAFDERGDGDLKHLAYLLGTTKHETADTMAPIYERGQKSYFAKYEPGTKIGKALGNTAKGDGYRYRGRGFVQLTGRANYRKFGIEDDPDKALEPDIAANILVIGCLRGWFTGKKLSDYKTFTSMRRVVNGTDKAELIAGYAQTFLRALDGLPATKAPEVPAAPETPPTGLAAALVAIIRFILGLFKRST
jgi:putative chitinase